MIELPAPLHTSLGSPDRRCVSFTLQRVSLDEVANAMRAMRAIAHRLITNAQRDADFEFRRKWAPGECLGAIGLQGDGPIRLLFLT